MTPPKLPPALEDLIEDLKESKMLPFIGALLAAIVAVLVLLPKGAEPVSPAPAADAGSAADLAPLEQAAVLADNTSIRHFRKRLSGNSRDPFKQQYTKPVGNSTELQTDTAATGGDSGTDSGGSTSTSTGTSTSTSTSTVSSGSGSADTTSTETIKVDKPKDDEKVYYDHEATVTFGVIGAPKEKLELRRGDVLGEDPKVTRMTSASDDRASFEITYRFFADYATDIVSDGKCDPGPNRCFSTDLKPGEKVRYATKDTSGNRVVFVVLLKSIDKITVDKDGNKLD